jgi:hypothetical protein
VRFALLQQRRSQAVSGFSVSRLQFGLRPKLFFRFGPLESAGIHLAQFEVDFGQSGRSRNASLYSFSASGIRRSTK